MNFNLSHQEYSTLNSVMFGDDSFDEYLYNSDLSVSNMIKQYDVSLINNERKKEKRTLYCTVCGAKAVGYNFDQISCESCKAFFRRNALRNISELRCRFSGHCNITIDSRRHCPYCRIKKCFDVGMRKEWIRSEEEKTCKRVQQEKNRRRKHLHSEIETPSLMVLKPPDNPELLTQIDRIRLNNITHCYDQYTGEPCSVGYAFSPTTLFLRIHELFNRKLRIFSHLVSYFKNLPEFKNLDVDDQVSLIKRNIRLLSPLNYALLRVPINSKFGTTHIETVGCENNANLHEMLRSLADIFVDFAKHDPLVMKLLVIVLFFTPHSLTTKSIYDPGEYKQMNNIKQIQASYTELLWLYMIEKHGEQNAIHLFTKMITKYLYTQIIIDQVDSIIEVNNDIKNIAPLMQTMLQLT